MGRLFNGKLMDTVGLSRFKNFLFLNIFITFQQIFFIFYNCFKKLPTSFVASGCSGHLGALYSAHGYPSLCS